MVDRELVQQKVRQVLYAPDAYDVSQVFETSEYTTAKRMFSDHLGRKDYNSDEKVVEVAENAVSELEELIANAE